VGITTGGILTFSYFFTIPKISKMATGGERKEREERKSPIERQEPAEPDDPNSSTLNPNERKKSEVGKGGKFR